ncbi:MAG TPA: hypothetical protein VFK43_02095 [Acidimicrobiales bacterium]|nr:hypothetical protein [Acidimicrobiales bacterium]
MVSRYQRHGRIPVGYGWGFAGLALFGAGGAGDMVWHMVFGVEVDLEALLSPTHLVLFLSGILIVTSPLRAAWSDAGQRSLPLPALLSTTILTATVAFFHMHLSPFLTDAMRAEPYRFARTLDRGGGWLADELQLEGFSAILITTLILIAPTLLLLRRWRMPAGSLTLLFGVVVAMDSALLGFEMEETIAAGVVAGIAGDLLVQALQPTRSPATVLRIVGFAVPVVLWLTYFAVLAAFYSVGWSVELWSGITVMSGLAGLGLAVLMTLEPPVTASAAGPPHL